MGGMKENGDVRNVIPSFTVH